MAYMNTTYKAFVAETAAKVTAEISKEFAYAVTRVENAIYEMAVKLQQSADSLDDIRDALCDTGNIDINPIQLIAESVHKMQGDTESIANEVDKLVSTTVED